MRSFYKLDELDLKLKIYLQVFALPVRSVLINLISFQLSAVPELRIVRPERAPRFAYGFGSGFASDIGGVKHSNSIGASVQTGDGVAQGVGLASTDNGGIFANGIGYAHTNPAPVVYSAYPYSATPYYTYPYNTGYNVGYNNGYNNFRTPLRDSYGNNIATAQNIGASGNSNAYSQNGQFGNFAIASNINNPYQARNPFENLGVVVSSSAVSGGGVSNAKSYTQTYDRDGGISATVAASEDTGDARASTAQTYQQRGNEVQNSGATSINAPGIQATHSHSINTGAAGTFY